MSDLPDTKRFVWEKHAPRETNLVPAFFQAVENYGYLQMPFRAIAAAIGISPSLMQGLVNEVPEVSEAYERGRLRLMEEVTKKYVDKVALMDGHAAQPRALEFILERKGGWAKAPETAIQINTAPVQFPMVSNQDLDNLLEDDDV